MNNTIKPNDISRNKEAVDRYCSDPLVHDRISAALASSLFRNMEKIHREAARITAPILMLNGTADTLSPIAGSHQLIEEMVVDDKQLQTFEGSCHEIFEDPEWSDPFYYTILEWLQSH